MIIPRGMMQRAKQVRPMLLPKSRQQHTTGPKSPTAAANRHRFIPARALLPLQECQPRHGTEVRAPHGEQPETGLRAVFLLHAIMLSFLMSPTNRVLRATSMLFATTSLLMRALPSL